MLTPDRIFQVTESGVYLFEVDAKIFFLWWCLFYCFFKIAVYLADKSDEDERIRERHSKTYDYDCILDDYKEED